MRQIFSAFVMATLSCAATGSAVASTLAVSTTGSFNSADSADALVQPGAAWRLSFDVQNPPSVSNGAADGFDIGYSNFQYSLNGSAVAVTPVSIRFYEATNSGLFTVFFGPESGVDASGSPIPEFVFSGGELFSGPTSKPILLPGSENISEFLYTDAANYDDQLMPGMMVNVNSVATPEPAPGLLFLLGAFLVMFAWQKRRLNPMIQDKLSRTGR